MRAKWMQEEDDFAFFLFSSSREMSIMKGGPERFGTKKKKCSITGERKSRALDCLRAVRSHVEAQYGWNDCSKSEPIPVKNVKSPVDGCKLHKYGGAFNDCVPRNQPDCPVLCCGWNENWSTIDRAKRLLMGICARTLGFFLFARPLMTFMVDA